MAGPIIVEGPDGQEYEFPEGTAPDVMKQAMRKRYGGGTTAPQAAPASPFLQRATGMLPEGTQPVFPAGAQATPPQMRASLPPATEPDRLQNRTDSASLAKLRKVEADIANATRKARVGLVERAAGREGIAQLDQGPITANPNAAYSEFMLPPDAQRGMQAEREVYRENDVTSSVDAATIRGLNSTLLGIPGIVNKDFRGELAAAGNDQPGASLAGDVAGFLAPSIGAWNTTRAGVNALARPFIPQGAGAAARGTRYLVPRAGEVAGVAAQNAYFQGAIQEPIRSEQAGEELTLGGMADAAAQGLKDPLNLLPLGLSGVNRTWNALTSGIATPSNRAAQMANQYGVGPRQTTASQGIAQTTQQLGGQLQGADIRGLTNIENALRFALRDNPNIRDINTRIADGFQRIRQSLPLEDDPTLNLARLIEREFANDAPQTRDIIRRFLLKVGMETPGGEAIVGGAANEIRGQQADVLRTEAESAFGAQPRTEANAAIQGSLDQFSQAYNTVLRGAPTTGPQVDRARALLAREPQSMAILDDVAQSRNMTPEQFVERSPLEALHLVQSELASQARAMAARGDAGAGPLEITVRNMQRPLREGVPGYGELQGLWRQWTQARERMGYVRGAEAGTAGELDTVPGFGDKVLGAGGVRNSEMGTQTAADVFLQMDELSQRAAGLSVRDVISDELRKMKAAGVDQRYAAPARMAQVATEGGLDALRRVFGEAGERVARRIEQFIDANDFARAIDPQYNSATMNKGQAMATGAQPFAGGMGQRAQGMSNALSESAIADSVLMLSGAPPIISAMRAPGIIGKMLQPGQRTQRNIASTLLRRGEIGSQVPPPPGGPPPITPIDPANVPGGGAPPPGAPPSGGMPPPQVPPGRPANALSGQVSAPMPAPIRPPPPPPRNDPIEWSGSSILTAGIGGGGRGPRKPTVGKPKRDIGTKVADATAIGILATGGPTAEAETGDAETRIAELSQSQANAQQQITEYEQALKTFEAMAPKEKQAFLKNNGYTGPNGETINPDGDVRGLTGFAIQAYKSDLNGALEAQKAERESFRKQINQIRVGLAQKPEKQTNPLLDKVTEYATYGALAYGAHRFRGARIKGSQVSANRAAAKANALLTRLPVPPEPPRRTLYSRVPVLGSKDAARIKRETNAANKAQFATEERLAGRDTPPISANPTSPDGLPNRLANVDEFDRQRAAGDFGPVGRIGRLMEPVNSRLRGSDLAVIGTGAADTYITEGMIRETRADIAAEEKRLDAALKANNGEGDPDAIKVSSRRLEQLRQAETVQVILQRIGIGMMIGGGFGLTHGRYARPQPRFEAAARERDLINRAMAPPPPPPTNALAPTSAPRKPRAPGPQKPKPKPPVSFSGGRSRKAENDNDR